MVALDVDPDEVRRTASGWRSYAAELAAQSPPSVSDSDGWASTAAVSAFHERVHNANNGFRRRLEGNADLIDDSGRNYRQQDDDGAFDMQAAGGNAASSAANGPSHKDMASIFSGTFKDLSGALTAGLSSAASGVGALGSAVASAAGSAANATTQIGTTLAQNATKSGPAGVGPAMGAAGSVAHSGSGRGGDDQTHVAAAAVPQEAPAVSAAPPVGAVLVREGSAAAAPTAMAPAAFAPHGPRTSTAKVRPVLDGGGDASDNHEDTGVAPSVIAYPSAFAKAVVEVPDAGKP